jgi:hypothetical protein
MNLVTAPAALADPKVQTVVPVCLHGETCGDTRTRRGGLGDDGVARGTTERSGEDGAAGPGIRPYPGQMSRYNEWADT